MKNLLGLFLLNCNLLWAQSFEIVTPGVEKWEMYPAARWGECVLSSLAGNGSICHTYDNSLSSDDRIALFAGEADLSEPFSWKFRLRYPNNPSSTNNWGIYLFSARGAEGMHPDSVNRGLILGVNLRNTDDSVRLYYQEGRQLVTICNAGFTWEESLPDSLWVFELELSKPYINLQVKRDGRVHARNNIPLDFSKFSNCSFFGLFYRYTSTKDRLLGLSGLSIIGVHDTDTLPPVLRTIECVKPTSLQLIFDEAPVISGSTSVACGEGMTAESLRIEGNSLIAVFPRSFLNREEYPLEVRNLGDNKGNTASISGSFVFFLPERHDVIFSEIMADPLPVVYLPEKEYLELYNRSGFDVNLTGWELRAGTRSFIFPETYLDSGAYLLVTQGPWDASPVKSQPLFTSGSVIANSGQDLILQRRDGEIIDAVRFDDSWYRDDFKRGGGWSLERIDPSNVCGEAENWKAAVHSDGGTPGMPNSVYDLNPDLTAPEFLRVEYLTDTACRLGFSEPLHPGFGVQGMQPEISSGNLSITKVLLVEPFRRELELHFAAVEGRPEGSIRFAEGCMDCAGNQNFRPLEILYSKPQVPALTDVVISEVLFSTLPGCPEYIELYNRSEKHLLLSDIRLRVSSSDTSAAKGDILSEQSFFFHPGQYLALTISPGTMSGCYQQVQQPTLFKPQKNFSLSDNGATISLFNRSGVLLDEFSYTSEMHFPLYTDTHGVSLERLSLDAATGNASEWYSASGMLGFATPGQENSHFVSGVPEENHSFYAESEVFSPDNDGYRDLAVFRYRFEKDNYVGTVRVFDVHGRVVRILGMNELLTQEGWFTWDGRSESGGNCASGIYLVQLDAYHLSGQRKRFRTKVVSSGVR
jgi:hypothetical protein